MRAVSGWIVGNYMQCTPGSSARTQGTAVPREREAQTEQHMLGHRFPAWNKSTGLSFISNVCDLHERTTVTQPQQCVVRRGLIDRISYFACNPRAPPHPPSPLPPRTTWWWLLHYSSEHVASGAGVKCSSSVLVHVTADGTFYLSYWETEVINWKCAFYITRKLFKRGGGLFLDRCGTAECTCLVIFFYWSRLFELFHFAAIYHF